MSYQYVLPGEIEKRSFEILTKELGDRNQTGDSYDGGF